MAERRVPRPLLDWERYRPIAERSSSRGAPTRCVVIAPDSGRAITVTAGEVLRLSCPDGPQVADVCFWSAEDPTERLWANQTLNREGTHVTTRSRLWGTMPRFRPLATVVADTLTPIDTGTNAKHHIVLGAHCNEWLWYLATGRRGHPSCYAQLCDAATEAAIDIGLVHDNVNFFQKTRIDPVNGQYVTERSDARAGDYVELYAEIDLVVGISACPMGSGEHRAESGRRDPLSLIAETFATGTTPQRFVYAEEVARLHDH